MALCPSPSQVLYIRSFLHEHGACFLPSSELVPPLRVSLSFCLHHRIHRVVSALLTVRQCRPFKFRLTSAALAPALTGAAVGTALRGSFFLVTVSFFCHTCAFRFLSTRPSRPAPPNPRTKKTSDVTKFAESAGRCSPLLAGMVGRGRTALGVQICLCFVDEHARN